MSTHVVPVRGLDLWCERFGADHDPAVLLLCGFGYQAIEWQDDFCQRLAARGRLVIRWDYRDIGLS